MAVCKHVGFHHDRFSHCPLNGESTGIHLRLYCFDYDSPATLGETHSRYPAVPL
jgi:hypothetical protein